LCDAHPSFQILPILLLILCNGGLLQSSVLNFLLVKSGLWKTQSIDFSVKNHESVTFCRFDQSFIENSTLVLQLGVFVRSRRPLGRAVADRRCFVRSGCVKAAAAAAAAALVLLMMTLLLLLLLRRRKRRRRQKLQRRHVTSS
jgi:hypothetical protein